MEHFSDERVLFQTYYKDVFRACYYMLQNKYDAEDLCQEVFAKALSEDFRAIQNQKSWLLSIAMNMSRNYLKKKNRLLLKENFNFLSSKQFDNTQNIEQTIQINENKSELVDLMNKLPVRIRKVMVLKYVHDCKDREIAHILKIPEGTVKSRHFKGKKLMEKFIEVDKNLLLEWRGHRE
ncbi:RNA polymerase sigma factor [Lysinibacillus xylanilyticus]|uniref:RNA polymerase sigma factor n=1 Tax=Lysinibacillus xylanilyticus TaxID=582475 RepID=A0ABT4EVA7_9BACI|nr:RNA polymerase sigma factor [Lysinibacillus xylanilyticus]MCY9549609.1 RNA polymerase sigma factor [Lysinibacillus xylanilyticus]MED3802928.1 RNA polymerase sigma factor [Lysinibacillus xylanilyticus]